MIATETKPTDSVGTGEAWKVIILNDNHNTFDGVAQAVAKHIPGMNYDDGMKIANEVHSSGSAIVWSGPLEPAELYLDLLSGEGLTMAPLEK